MYVKRRITNALYVSRKLDTQPRTFGGCYLAPPCEAGDDGAESGCGLLFIFRAGIFAGAMAGPLKLFAGAPLLLALLGLEGLEGSVR